MVEQERSILVINPNSSESITKALEAALLPQSSPSTRLTFLTGPSYAPPSINDAVTSIQSAQAVFVSGLSLNDTKNVERVRSTHRAILICCFSNHPLAGMIRQALPGIPALHILDTAISAALTCASGGAPFGILTTGRAMVPDIDQGVLQFLGGASTRYAGCIPTDLGVLELQDPEPKTKAKVQRIIREKAALLAQRNAGAIILGCAGMAGMEALVRSGVAEAVGEEAASKVAIIDGAKAGVQILDGLSRCNFYA